MSVINGADLLVTQFNMAQLPALIKVKAAKFELDYKLVAAVVLKESAGKPWRCRYEPGFYRRLIQNLKRKDLPGFVPDEIPTLNTEKTFRAASWGLMQCMAETAREVGFAEEDIPMLLIPEINIEIGCKILRHKYNQDIEKTPLQHSQQTKFFRAFLTPEVLKLSDELVRTMMMLLRYNGGSDLNYPGDVLAKIDNGEVSNFYGGD